jgi:hypothetical protein
MAFRKMEHWVKKNIVTTDIIPSVGNQANTLLFRLEPSETIHGFFFNLCGGTLGTAATTGLLYQPRMIRDGDCGEIGGINIGRGNRSTR